jgi:hypothetical protein
MIQHGENKSFSLHEREQRTPGGSDETQKKPSILPDAELERLCNALLEIIDALSLMGERCLTEGQQMVRLQKLEQALDATEFLEIEQMSRLVRKVQARVGYRVALSQQKRTDLRQRRRRDND